ncbi:dickkopf-related protein 3-like [Ahaetulla prasina]|uniref:dickkopf-related protein 3-like n=1 Tax=Ahaetulla prasina TaxID=499056 RepID=UPI002648B876|nr:dickkopf-related protein 3-like [Ahaetulla prasina]
MLKTSGRSAIYSPQWKAAQSYIWAWIYTLPGHSANEVAALMDPGPSSSLERMSNVCSPETDCPLGFFCDLHFEICRPLKQEGEYCRHDTHCASNLTCMFGKCLQTAPKGHEGARCHHNKDCSPGFCCARIHGEMVCKKRLILDEKCHVPQGGIAFSMNQLCPCLEGLVCRRMQPKREKPFEYEVKKDDWRCQKK